MLIIFFSVSFCIIGSTAVAQDNGGYDITIENREIDIPEQTRTVNGEEFSATSIGFVEPEKQITVRVNPSTDDPYDILLYDRDKKRLDAQFSATGETTAAFNTGDLDPGAYIVTVRTDRTEAVQPIIIQAYETRVSLPSDIGEGDSITADIGINEYSTVDAPDIGKVELVIVDATTGTVIERSSAERIDQFEYGITTTADYDTGEYQIYTAVYNNNGAEDDELDLISVSDRYKLTVGEQSNEKNSTSDSDDISEDQETSEDQDNEGNDDKNRTSDKSSTNNTNVSNENENTNTTELKETNSSKSSEDETEDTTSQGNSSEGIIEPNEPTPPSDTSSEEVPLNGTQLLIIMLLSVAVGAKIRNRN